MVALSEHVAGEGGTVAFDVAQIDVRHEPHRVVVVVPFNGDGNVAAAVGGVGFLDFAVGEAAGELRAPVVGVVVGSGVGTAVGAASSGAAFSCVAAGGSCVGAGVTVGCGTTTTSSMEYGS